MFGRKSKEQEHEDKVKQGVDQFQTAGSKFELQQEGKLTNEAKALMYTVYATYQERAMMLLEIAGFPLDANIEKRQEEIERSFGLRILKWAEEAQLVADGKPVPPRVVN